MRESEERRRSVSFFGRRESSSCCSTRLTSTEEVSPQSHRELNRYHVPNLLSEGTSSSEENVDVWEALKSESLSESDGSSGLRETNGEFEERERLTRG